MPNSRDWDLKVDNKDRQNRIRMEIKMVNSFMGIKSSMKPLKDKESLQILRNNNKE